jgi:hypothetical protein
MSKCKSNKNALSANRGIRKHALSTGMGMHMQDSLIQDSLTQHSFVQDSVWSKSMEQIYGVNLWSKSMEQIYGANL